MNNTINHDNRRVWCRAKTLLALLLLLTLHQGSEALASPSTTNHRTSPSTTDDDSASTPIHTLILTRHGDSVWNGGQPGTLETFTGWTDVPLSEKGIQEAKDLGAQVATYSHGIDACFTSVLQRAQLTAHHCLWAFENQPQALAPQKYVMDYRLNERHYGSLQGMVKQHAEQSGEYDASDVQAWRRSWHAVPPLLDDNDPRRVHELRQFLHYCGNANAVPRGESLAMVAQNRIQPFLNQVLTPVLNEAAAVNGNAGATGLIVAHANSLRALIGVLCNVEQGDPASLARLEAIKIPTGVPLVLRYRPTSTPGFYQMCEIPGLDDRSTSGRPLPHLPLWPLSAIPRATPQQQALMDQNSSSSIGEAGVIRRQEPRQLSSSAAAKGVLRV